MASNSEYNGLKEYLEYHYNLKLGEGEMEDILDLADRQIGYNANEGYLKDRIETNPREKAFYQQWKAENIPQPGYNFGFGILQDLFCERVGPLDHVKIHMLINERDRYIVATVIQWLGTNVGYSFLKAALRRFEATIEEKM